MDPVTALGAAAAAAQFTGVAIKAIKLIKDICSGVKDAPEAIKRHVGQLETLNDTATRVKDNSTLAADPATEAILRECTATAAAVASLLEGLRSSDGDNLAKRGWKAVVGMSREQDIVRLLDDLERSRASLLVHIATVNSSQSDTITQTQQNNGKGLAAIQSMLEYAQIAGDEGQVFLRAMFLTDPRDDRAALLSVKGLWILGGPGMGKSMMSIFLTQHLEASVRTQQKGTVIYFFCDNRDSNKNNVAAVLRGLIWQLGRLKPRLLRHGLAELRSRGGQPESLRGVDALRRIFCEMLDDSESGQDISASALKVFVRLRLDPDSADQISADLKTFIQERVGELSEAKGYPPSLRQLVEQAFAKKSESTFLWVGFAARELRTIPINDVERYLGTLPSGLSGIYDRIFKNIHPNHLQRVQQVFLLAVIAYHPLTLEQVASMLSIRPSETLASLEIVQSIISQCENLVVVVNGRINLVHQSVKDYILRQPENPRQSSIGYHIRPEIAHKQIGDELAAIASQALRFFEENRWNLGSFIQERRWTYTVARSVPGRTRWYYTATSRSQG
ncbi:ankyrin repeat protein [Colletotrichum plurivorum]|uniref:Ankyrin repeat protein n=1 Tax=Colletotrichum plurivorum TaxID=2175906 RepID=A0A8H6JAI9_9PEZI|nr:ankyrin repeat protein [Colletotrichum plurivorum]